jgi:hypothetical protein
MTTASHAIGFPAIGRPRADTIEVAPKPLTRQDRARRATFKVAAGVVGAVLLATAQQVTAEGWRSFVFRAPGVGGTPARSEAVSSPVDPVTPIARASGALATPARQGAGGASGRSGPLARRDLPHLTTGRSAGWASTDGTPSASTARGQDVGAVGRPAVIHVPRTDSVPTTTPTDSPTPFPTSAASPPPPSSPKGNGTEGGSAGNGPPLPPPPRRPPPPPRPGPSPPVAT